MERVEQFIREGFEGSRGPVAAYLRQFFASVIFTLIISVLMYIARLGWDHYGATNTERLMSFLMMIAVVGVPVFILGFNRFSSVRLHRRIWRARALDGKIVPLPDSVYVKAAEALRVFEPATYEQAIEKYGQDVIDVLFLAEGIWLYAGRLHRLVSIQAIEEDMDRLLEKAGKKGEKSVL